MKRTKEEENTYLKKLSIQVSLDGFSFYGQIEPASPAQLLDHYQTKETSSPEKILDEIIKTVEKNKIKEQHFEEVEVIYHNELFTVVPTAIFNPDNLTDYLKYNIKILSTDFLAYDELPKHDLHIVYIPFANINNFFFDCFGSFTYHHHISLFLENALQNIASDHKKQIRVQIHSSSFDLIALDGKKLLIINTFTYHTPEDFLYHILFCYEQLNFDPNIHELVISGSINIEDPLYNLSHGYIRNISLLSTPFATSAI